MHYTRAFSVLLLLAVSSLSLGFAQGSGSETGGGATGDTGEANQSSSQNSSSQSNANQADSSQNGSSMTMAFQGTQADFRIFSALDTLIADNDSETTVVALLSTEDGNTISGERIRFVVESGNAFFGDTGKVVTVDAEEVGEGVYSARLRAGVVEGPVSVTAIWVSAPDVSLPEVSTSVDVVTASDLAVEVEDDVLLNDGQDNSTIVAYLKDGLNRPVNNANVTFRLVSGSGALTPVPVRANNSNGRYAAVYEAGTSTGQAEIEVALPTNTQMLRSSVTISVVEATTLEAEAFPAQVARRTGDNIQQSNTATILVPIRDGDGDLVRGLSGTDLVAQVVSGPGSVTGPEEIVLANNQRSGVYKFTFTSAETTGTSTVRVTDLSSPSQVNVDTDVETVTQTNPSRVNSAELFTYADDPFYADGGSSATLLILAADRSGNAVTNLGRNLEISVTEGQGTVSGVGTELGNLAASGAGTGIYLATYLSGSSAADTTAQLRTTFVNNDGTIINEEMEVNATPLGSPRVVIFPDRIPSGQSKVSTIDVFDFDARSLADLQTAGLMSAGSDSRYRVNLVSGPGTISETSTSAFDLVDGDSISTSVYESDSAMQPGPNQEVAIRVIDLAASGYPATEASLNLGQTTNLRAITVPTLVDQGDTIEIIVFAQDEFGLPAVRHELALTVTSGSGQALGNGRLIDNGSTLEGYRDPFANDGMYIGALRATGAQADTINVTITDLSAPDEPEVTLSVEVGQ